jgi:hypothetical protein
MTKHFKVRRFNNAGMYCTNYYSEIYIPNILGINIALSPEKENS